MPHRQRNWMCVYVCMLHFALQIFSFDKIKFSFWVWVVDLPRCECALQNITSNVKVKSFSACTCYANIYRFTLLMNFLLVMKIHIPFWLLLLVTELRFLIMTTDCLQYVKLLLCHANEHSLHACVYDESLGLAHCPQRHSINNLCVCTHFTFVKQWIRTQFLTWCWIPWAISSYANHHHCHHYHHHMCTKIHSLSHIV